MLNGRPIRHQRLTLDQLPGVRVTPLKIRPGWLFSEVVEMPFRPLFSMC